MLKLAKPNYEEAFGDVVKSNPHEKVFEDISVPEINQPKEETSIAAYAPYLATKAVKGIFEPILSPLKTLGMDTEKTLDTAIEYWEKKAPDFKLPNIGVGKDKEGKFGVHQVEDVSGKQLLGEIAGMAGFTAPASVALGAGGLVAETTKNLARPFYRRILQGMIGGALLGEGEKDKTLENMALFGVFEGAGYALDKIPNVVKSIKDSNWYRKATIKERGLVFQNIEDTLKANPEMTEAELVRNSASYYKEALEKRKTGEAENKFYQGAFKDITPEEVGVKAIEAPVVEEVRPTTELKDKKQQEFIDKKVESLGSLEAVKKQYSKDDAVSKYAREKAALMYGGEAELDKLAAPVEVDRTGYDVIGKGFDTQKGKVIPFKQKWQAKKDMEVSAQKAGAATTEYDLKEQDGGWVYQRRKIEIPVSEYEKAFDGIEIEVQPLSKEERKSLETLGLNELEIDAVSPDKAREIISESEKSKIEPLTEEKSIDQETQWRVSSSIEQGQEPGRTVQEYIGSEEATATGGNVQAYEGKEVVHTMPDGSVMAGPEHEGTVVGSTREIQSPEEVVAEFNKQYPGHSVKFDGIQKMPEVMKDKPDKVYFTPTEGGAKKATMALDVDKFTVEELKKKVDEKVKQFSKGATLYSGMDPIYLAKEVAKLGKDSYLSLKKLGEQLYEKGDSYFDWQKRMKDFLSDVWDKVKTQVAKVWEEIKRPVANQKGSLDLEPLQDAKRFIKSGFKFADKNLGLLIDRIQAIDPVITIKLRRMYYTEGVKTNQIKEFVMPFIKKTKQMSKEDYKAFDLARWKNDEKEVKRLVNKYKMQQEYQDYRGVLDMLFNENIASGNKVNYRQNYHPTGVTDLKGLHEYLNKNEEDGTLDRFIAAKEEKLGRKLTEDESIKLFNSLFRGFTSEGLSLSKPGQLNIRSLDRLKEGARKYYGESNAELLRYISDSVKSIERNRFFGKKGENLEESIGKLLLDINKRKKLKSNELSDLRAMLDAVFNPTGPDRFVSTLKNITYADLLANPLATLRQFSDNMWTAYETISLTDPGSLVYGPKAFAKALMKMSDVTLKDLGITKIAEEFEDSSKSAAIASGLMRSQLFGYVDTLGKETLVNALNYQAQSWANRNPKRVEQIKKKLAKSVEENLVNSIVGDLKGKRLTDNVKFYLYSKTGDYHPISPLETPEGYQKGGNNRWLYTLRTYTLRFLGVLRREAIREIFNLKTTLSGFGKLIKILGLYSLFNVPVDMLQDIILGREPDIKSITVDNFVKIFGMNKYATEKALSSNNPWVELLKAYVPPLQIASSAIQDAVDLATDNWKGSELVKSIPFGGKIYYYRWGKGAAKREEKAGKGVERTPMSSGRSRRNALIQR